MLGTKNIVMLYVITIGKVPWDSDNQGKLSGMEKEV